MSSSLPQDTFVRQEILQGLDRLTQQLTVWLHGKLLRYAGQNWWERNVAEILDDEDKARIRAGEWKRLEDLDLHALLKVLNRNFRFLKSRERWDDGVRGLIYDMQQVRHRCVGHRPARGNDLKDLLSDLTVMGEFAKWISCSNEAVQEFRILYLKVQARLSATGDAEVVVAPRSPSVVTVHTTNAPQGGLASFYDCEVLTPSQSAAIASLQAFLDSPNERCFILRGYAGTGKTFLIGGLVRYLRSLRRQTMMMAPTGRAAYVLRDRHQIEASTIHRSIYSLRDLKEYREVDENGDVTYKFYFETRNNDIDHDTVFIVDEASMISDAYTEAEFMHFGSGRVLHDLLEFINFDANDYRKKLILVGDGAQLPPVGMNTSPALDPEYLTKRCRLKSQSAELTEVVRQMGQSLILKNATQLRTLLREKNFSQFDFECDGREITEVGTVEFVRRFAADYVQESLKPQSVIVAYTNAECSQYNKAVRNLLKPGRARLAAGDRVIIVKNNYNHGIPLLNGQMAFVLDAASAIESRSVPINVGLDETGKRRNEVIALRFRDVELTFEGQKGEPVRLKCKIIEDCIESLDRDLSSAYSKALWADFRQRNTSLRPTDPEFRKALLADPYFNAVLLKFGYAVTCHKAQGGEWPAVFIDFAGMNKLNAEAIRWSYTALTRASKTVVATNALHHGLLTPLKSNVSGAIPPPPVTLSAPPSKPSLPPQVPATSVASAAIPAMANDTPLLLSLRQEIAARLPAGWSIVGCGSLPNHVLCRIARDGYESQVRVYYTDDRRVSRVQIASGKKPDKDAEIEFPLRSLKNVSLDLPPDGRGNILPEHEEFWKALKAKAHATGLNLCYFESKTEYHAIASFRQGHNEGRFNYHFNKRRQLVRAPEAHPGTTPELITVVRGLSE